MLMQNELRVLMARKKINTTELAKNIGVSRNTITAIYYEKVSMIRYDTLVKLCSFFECTPNDIIKLPKEI